MYAPNCFQNKKYIFRPNFKIEWIPPWNDKRLGWKFVSLLHFLCDSIIVHIKWSITIILFIFSPQGLPWNQTCQFEYIIEPWFNCVCATTYKYYRPIAMHFRILIDTKMLGFNVPVTYLSNLIKIGNNIKNDKIRYRCYLNTEIMRALHWAAACICNSAATSNAYSFK